MRELLEPTDGPALAEILGQCPGIEVTVVGDVMLDEYVTGVVERISPEAPVPVVRAAANEFRLGGAANVARQVASLGARVTLIGVIGADDPGDMLCKLCEESAIPTDSLIRAKDRRTTRKLRVLSQNQQLLRVDWEDCHEYSTATTAALIEKIDQHRSCGAVILSDYAKGALNDAVIQAVNRRRNASSASVIVDPKHRDFSRYRGASLLTPNLRELSEASGTSLNTADLPAIAQAARAQNERGGFAGLVVTLGDRGMLIVMADGFELLIPAMKRAVYDVTGAGDTAVAVLAACLATGASVMDASRIANAAAGIAVGEVGAVAVSAAKIADALVGRAQGKVLALEPLRERVEQWRQQGLRIVFTNGCFDLLHPGHLSLLNYAKSLGDTLVLAINSDDAVRRLKGPGRPLVGENDRAAMLGALGCVDAVTIFDEDTPLNIVGHIRPHILVKGSDYRMDQVVGRETVEALGGRVVLAPLLPNYSTTSLLARSRA